MANYNFYATGARKTAVAKVWVKSGKGRIIINGNPPEEYFGKRFLGYILSPFEKTNSINSFDVKVNVSGGGVSAQAQAIRHGISKAIVVANPDFKNILKQEGFLTRDPREKERKKYGQPGRRKHYQYSKR